MRVTLHLDGKDGDNEWIKVVVVVDVTYFSRTKEELEAGEAFCANRTWRIECCGRTDGLV